MSSEERRNTAIHEAGHVVVAWTLGLPVGAMEVGIGGDDTVGKSEIADTGSLSTIDHIALCAAGVEAERVFGCSAPRDHSAWSDYSRIEMILDNMPIEKAEEMLFSGHDRAFEILNQRRFLIELVAEHLARNGRLEESDVRALLARP